MISKKDSTQPSPINIFQSVSFKPFIKIYSLNKHSTIHFVSLRTPPNSSELNPIVYENDSFIITWSQNNDDDFQSYTLHESYSEDMSNSTVIFETTEVENISYTVEGVSYGEIRYYQLVVEDYWGQESIPGIVRVDSYPKIVYIKSSGNDGYLHRVNVDGTGDVELDDEVFIYFNRQPRFYDNGNKIGYVSGHDIIVMDLDGSNQVIIPNMLDNGYGGSIQHDNLIPYKVNDEVIIFNNNEQKIYSMSLDGSNLTTLLDYSSFGSGVGTPVISPDGQKVLYSKNTFSNGNYYHYLYVVDIDGTNNTQVVETDDIFSYDFTPNGSQIVWLSYGFVSGEISLMKINIDGSDLTQIVEVVNGGGFSISNNGDKIVFEKDNNLWIVDIDGNNLNQLTNYGYIDMKNCQFSKNDYHKTLISRQ